MNKEEIETYTKILNKYNDYVFEFEDDNIKIANIKQYIEQLENKVKEQDEEKEELIKYIEHEVDIMGSGSSMFIVKTALKVVLSKLKGEN